MAKPTSPAIPAGTPKVPGYVIESFLGRGGSGEVWRARVTRSAQSVALKRLPITDPVQVAAARAEAAILSALDHPHLIRLHDVVRTSDALVLVLDLANEGSLADLLARRTRLTPGEVVTALAPIGAALAYAHAEGVVHGDVSAANVLFTSVGLPLLADLGVARIVGDDGPVRSTPAYLDPVVAHGHLPGPPTDVFCLAALAVHALRGVPLWPGPSAAEMTAQAAEAGLGEPIDIAALLPDAPESVRAVLGRALVAEPQLRSTATQFALDLRHSLQPTPVELRAGREPRPGFERPGERTSGAPMLDGQLTYGARLPPLRAAQLPSRRRWLPPLRPAQLPNRRRWLPSRLAGASIPIRSGRRVGVGGLCVVVAIAVGTGLLVRSRTGSSADSAPSSTNSTIAFASSAASPSPVAPPRTSTPATVDGGLIVDAASAAAVLAALDRRREQAFADRNQALFADVYSSADLMTQDTTALLRLVPEGCSLRGVHTDYSDVQVLSVGSSSGGGGAVGLAARATLAPSTLSCPGVADRLEPGLAITGLRLQLIAVDGGYRIASLLLG